MLALSRALVRSHAPAASIRPTTACGTPLLAVEQSRWYSEGRKESTEFGDNFLGQVVNLRPEDQKRVLNRVPGEKAPHKRRQREDLPWGTKPGPRPPRLNGLYKVSSSAIPQGASHLDVTAPDGTVVSITWFAKGMVFSSERDKRHRHIPQQLRDSCSCTACRDVSSGQKSFSTTQIPADMKITNVSQAPEGGLVVTVDKDMETHGGDKGHDILLSPSWLLSQVDMGGKKGAMQSRMDQRFRPDYWNGESLEGELCKIDYDQFMQEDSTAFWDVVREIMRLGIVMLSKVPRDEESVSRIAYRIANIRETFYGRTFDVRAKPNAENIAYTSGYLGLHQDLLYLNPPPFVQILHCMDNSCAGGESIFSDADRIGRILANLIPEYPFLASARLPIPYGYHRDGHWYHRTRPLLHMNNPGGKFSNVFWSPPFQAENTRPMHLDKWIPAARVFEEAVNGPEALFQVRMEPGDCVLFNNLRVLHGRRSFDAEGGSRWLRGAYISPEDFLSTAMHAPATHAAPLEKPDTWWDPNKTDEVLMEQPICDQLKARLDEVNPLKKKGPRV